MKKRNSINFRNASFLIAFYSQKLKGEKTSISPAGPLIDYLIKKGANFICFIDQPVALSEKTHLCSLEIYGKEGAKKLTSNFFSLFNRISPKRKKKGGTFFRLKIRDFFSVLYFGLILRKKFDFFIGSESINTLAGIILKRLKVVKFVIYYVIDLAPLRYKNKFLNWIYRILDKFCCYYSDFCWNNSPVYEILRLKNFKYSKKKIKPQINLGYGIDFEGINILPIDQLKDQVIFIGSIDKENGIELIIEAALEILKLYPTLTFKLIGGGPQETSFRSKIKKLNLEKSIQITGYFFDKNKIRKELCRSKIGLAIYPPLKYSIKPYGDPIKFKEYMAAGLPIITTDISWFAEKIKSIPLGIVIDFNKKDLKNAILKLLTDKKFFQICRKNVLSEIKKYSWEKIFDKAFRKCYEKISHL